MNPLNILSRGYSVTFLNDKALKSVKNVKLNDILDVKLSDGSLKTKVLEVKEEK